MCGRYTLTSSVEEIWDELGLPGEPGADVWSDDPKETLRPRFNIAPTQVAPVVTDRSPTKVVLLRWGLVPFWADDPKIGSRHINARSETVETARAFGTYFRDRRCIVPASGFYEWKREGKQKTPMYIRPASHRSFVFAGLWASWRAKDDPERRVVSFTILTTTPSPALAGIHDRMPVILDREARALWLDRDADPDRLKELLRPFESEPLEIHPVSSDVGSPKNDWPELVLPVAPEGERQGRLLP